MPIIPKLKKLILDRPVVSLIVLVFVIGLLSTAEFSLTGFFGPSTIFSILPIILIVIASILFAYLVVKILLDYLIQKPIGNLLTAKSLGSLLLSYIAFVLGILILISLMYFEINRLSLGYLTYSSCSDNFDPGMIANDPSISHDYFYFSAVTFFTIGYGDICPMGLSKILSVLTVFSGNIVNVILMGIVITLYLRRTGASKVI
ncbi:MAG: ion channel [Candidatus Micrarchaeota archaeon]